MHVTFAANGGWGAAKLCHRVNSSPQIGTRLFLRFERPLRTQCDRCQERSRPCPEIFCRKIFVRNLAQIIVHVLRCYVPHFAVIAHVLEQVLTWQILALRDNFRDSPIRYIYFMLPPALSAK